MHRKLGASRVWERKVAWRWSGECKSKKRGAYRQRRPVKSFNPDKLSMQLFSKYRNFTSCTDNITTTFWHIRKECPFVEEESPQQNLQWIHTFFPFSLIENNNNQQIVEADYCAQHDQFFLFLCTSLSAKSSKQAKEEAAAAIKYGQNISKLLCNKMWREETERGLPETPLLTIYSSRFSMTLNPWLWR